MNEQELYDKINQLPSVLGWQGHGAKVMIAKDSVLELIDQLNEPKKVVIPKFVAEWIEECKAKKTRLFDALMDNDAVNDWLDWSDGSNEGLFARAWMDGYEIEQEKLYTVEISNGKGWLVLTSVNGILRLEHIHKHFPVKLTESEIKQDFAWAWQWAEEVKEVE